MKKLWFLAVTAAVSLAGCGSSPQKGEEETPRRQDVINVAETRAPVLSVASATPRDNSAVLRANVVCEAGGFYWFEVTRQRDGFIHEFARKPCPTGKKSIPVEDEIKGLSPETDYFAQVRAEDSKRRLATSKHLEFRTGAVTVQAKGAAKAELKPAPGQPPAPEKPVAKPASEKPAAAAPARTAPATQAKRQFGPPQVTIAQCAAEMKTAKGFLPWKHYGGDPYLGSPEQAFAEFGWPADLQKLALAEVRKGDPAKVHLKRGDAFNGMAFGRLLPNSKAKTRRDVIACWKDGETHEADVYSVTWRGQEVKIFKPGCGNWSWRAVEGASPRSEVVPPEEAPPIVAAPAPIPPAVAAPVPAPVPAVQSVVITPLTPSVTYVVGASGGTPGYQMYGYPLYFSAGFYYPGGGYSSNFSYSSTWTTTTVAPQAPVITGGGTLPPRILGGGTLPLGGGAGRITGGRTF